MDQPNPCAFLTIALILCSLSLQSIINVEAASVVFIDNPIHKYLRSASEPGALSETDSMSLLEVGATVSVLLGLPPPPMLSEDGSSKLNKVLVPNPFDRPLAVFALEVTGIEDTLILESSGDAIFGGALKSKVLGGESKADIHIPDKDEVSVISLNDLLSFDYDAQLSDNELLEFASYMGGSNASGDLLLSGEMTIALTGGANLKLDMPKKAERELTTGLVGLLRKIVKVIVMHDHLSANGPKLITGSFDGIKTLQEHYGADVAEKGVELFATSVLKMFQYLQTKYTGEIVGVILNGESTDSESKYLLNMVVASHTSPRWLEETISPANATLAAEELLVRRTIAWITGILLIIATLFGVYFLLNMPLTRDTLLYSNVKLD